jgi:hypothetical protein
MSCIFFGITERNTSRLRQEENRLSDYGNESQRAMQRNTFVTQRDRFNREGGTLEAVASALYIQGVHPVPELGAVIAGYLAVDSNGNPSEADVGAFENAFKGIAKNTASRSQAPLVEVVVDRVAGQGQGR